MQRVPPTQERRKRWMGYLGRAAVLVATVALSVFLISARNEVEKFARFGYAGIFLFTLLTYATIILPVPGAAMVFSMGAVLNPLWVGVVAGAGAAVGQLTGYVVGYFGQAGMENVVLYQRVRDWMKQSRWKTFVGLIVLSAVPNPAADLAGIAAGVLRIPIPSYLCAVFIGEMIKMWVFAYSGAYSLDWIARFLR